MTALDPTTARRPVVVVATLLAVLAAGVAPVAADTTTTSSTTSTTSTTTTTTTTTTPPPPTTPPPTTPPTTSPQTTTTPATAPTTTTTAAPQTTTSSSSTTTSSTAPSTTTTTISPAQVAALLKGLNADLAKASAVDAFVQAKAAAAAALAAAQAGQAGPPAAAGADPALMKVAAGELAAGNAKDAAQRRLDSVRHRLGQMGVALYVHDDTAGDTSAASPSDGTAIDRSVLLSLLLSQAKTELTTAKRTLGSASQALAIAKVEADQVVNARAAAIEAKAQQVVAAATPTATTSPQSTGTTAAGPAGKTSTTKATRPARPQALMVSGPTILGSAALTGSELSAWYASAGHQARLTVPLNTLAGYYQSTGTAMGVRDDIAFAQAMIETGYFSFPSFGQVAVADNNYAGIGACDTCARGFTFPDAKTGVTAQFQLLHADASTQPVPPGPLAAPVGVSGCCPTWLALAGVWASASDYGYNILKLYKQMLEWTLQRRQANAGL